MQPRRSFTGASPSLATTSTFAGAEGADARQRLEVPPFVVIALSSSCLRGTPWWKIEGVKSGI